MKKLIKWLDINLEVVFCGIFFFAILIVILTQIFMRNILGHGLQWAEEVACYLHVWVTYIGIAYSTRMNRHICIDIFRRKLPESGRKLIEVIVQVILLAVFVTLFVGSVRSCIAVGTRHTMAASMDVSQNWMYMAAPIGYAMCIVRLFQTLIWKIKTFSKSWDLFRDQEGVYSGALETFCYPDYVIDDMKASRTDTAIKELEEMNEKKNKGGKA